MNGLGNDMYNQNNYYNNQFSNNITTNINKVTSLEEAIMKSNVRLSDMVYFNQSKDEFYNVRVDINGNKSWQTFPYTVPNNAANVPVTRADLDAIVLRLDELERKNKEVIENA